MSELRERLQEAADAAAREGRTPPAAALVTRGRHRRRRLIGGTAVLVVLVVVVGMVGANRVTDRPMPLTPTPTAGPARPTTPTNTTAPTQRWIPSVTPLTVKAQPGPYPGPDPGGIVRDATSMVRGCQGKSRIRLWLRAQKMVWLVAAKPTPPGQRRVCWAHALMNQGGGGSLALGLPKPIKPLEAIRSGGGGGNRLGVVSGTVTKRAVRLRVLFHKGEPLDLVPVDAGDQFPVNFYAGFYLEAGPPPAEGQPQGPAVDRVLAIDQAGKVVAQCRMASRNNTC